MVIEALITAGAGLIGGAVSRRNASREAARARKATSPSVIRKQAEEAGFNPLLFTPQMFSSAGTVAPTGQMGSAIANAGLHVANFMQRESEEMVRRQEAEHRADQLTQLVNSITLQSRPSNWGASRANNANIPSQSDGASRRSGYADARIGAPHLEGQPASVTSTGALNSNWYTDPTVSDAETAEARGGELAAEAQGVRALAADQKYNRQLYNASVAYDQPVDAIHQRVLSDPQWHGHVMAAPNVDLSVPDVSVSYLDPFLDRAERARREGRHVTFGRPSVRDVHPSPPLISLN